jgi:AraC-like DNA-binding protein
VLRPDQLARHLRLERSDCAPELAPWVENHWSLRWDLPAGTSYVSSTLPHPAFNLSVEHGGVREATREDPVVVTGVPTKRFDVTIRDAGWVHGVKFRPGGFAALAGGHAGLLRDRTVPATEVLPGAASALLAEVGPDHSPHEAREAVEAALTGLRAAPDPDYDTVLETIGVMLGDRELVRVAQVEETCGVGTRSLQRLFQAYVGVSPKWVLSRYRMHDVVTALDEGYDGSLADLAAAYGWFDQAHFTREFTDLVGVPPRTYRRPEG